MKSVGVIGVGNMGASMARNLINGGFKVYLFDVITENMQPFTSLGGIPCSSPREVAEQTEVIVLSLPNVPVLQEVILGENGILQTDIQGKTIIDTTTCTVKAAVELARSVEMNGGTMLDSPVTGGVGGAEKGSLSIMVGGDESAFKAHQDIYRVLGSNIVYIGESGHGQVSKLINQMLMGAIYCSVSESFGFAAQLGVDVEKVYRAVENGGGRSGLLSSMKSFIVSGNYGEGSYIKMHGKDIDYAIEEGNRHHSYMPITAAIHQVWNLARLKGFSELNAHSMFAVWEEILDKKLNSHVQ